jgi:hypothetical protein
MTQLYINAILILESQIKTQGRLMASSTDEYSVFYFNAKMHALQDLKSRIISRSGLNKNVIFVDFVSKQRISA